MISERTLSPRELARAIGASESSVKRWVDAGRIPAKLTSGGHRRIELMPALRFLRSSGRELAHPHLLGLAPSTEHDLRDPEALAEWVFDHLREGSVEELSQGLLTALVTKITEPAALFDGPLRCAMARVGQLWEAGRQGIYLEHRATQMLLRVVDQMHALFRPPADELVAVGGSIDGDPSALPTRMAATVLASEGLYPVNLGSDTPAAALLEAADQVGARLVWVSVSYVSDALRQGEDISRLVDQLAARGIACILGGRELHRLPLSAGAKAQVGHDMQELAHLARQIRREERERPSKDTRAGR